MQYLSAMRLHLPSLLFSFTLACDPAGGREARTEPLDRPARREVAITFDDLPGVAMLRSQRCDVDAYREMNEKLTRSISAHRIPALGLVVGSRLCERHANVLPGLLRIWLDAGAELGNHTFSHYDLNDTPLATYQADVIHGEAALGGLLEERGERAKYFRHPYLHAGNDSGTKHAFEAFLAQRGYVVAPVTIDNQEWVFAEVYARAKDRGDSATAARVGEAYLAYMNETFAFFEGWSVEVVGYEIKQVLLLHANPLNADYFDQLVEVMRRRGYAFISLDEALKDPAYALPDSYVGPTGLSWLHRWALTKGMPPREEPREPDFIAALFRNYFTSAAR
jgi:peptidoglycan/xylan/chitin deacetylase (PgdA/CDA1 family)